MKIGILTFHSQLNYGGVLQCWALQTALEKLGHEVVVIDRWLDKNNGALELGYKIWGAKAWVRFWMRSVLGLGDINRWLRTIRTKKFIKDHLKLTGYHFHLWNEAPEELGVDIVVIGSDQVWHCGDWGDPRAYLLEGASDVKAIAYSASFGMTELPRCLSDNGSTELSEPVYHRGLAKLRAISCREAEGVALCEKLGFSATHVVDPTLLVPKGEWCRLFGRCKPGNRLVCYFIGENIEDVLPELKKCAKQNKCKIDVFLDGTVSVGMPRSLAQIWRYILFVKDKWFGRVRLRDSAGPTEFLKSIASASWIISDSFHALMFSIIFGKNVRILRPRSEVRAKMFSRITEFANHANGNILSDNITDAVNSMCNGEVVNVDEEWLESRIGKSFEFLKDALDF